MIPNPACQTGASWTLASRLAKNPASREAAKDLGIGSRRLPAESFCRTRWCEKSARKRAFFHDFVSSIGLRFDKKPIFDELIA